MENIDGEISMEFLVNWFPNPPWNSMATIYMDFHGKSPNPPWRYFPWKFMEKFLWNSMENFPCGATQYKLAALSVQFVTFSIMY